MTESPPITLLRHRPYVRFVYARIAASVALQMNAVAVGWEMYALTGSAFDLGLVGLVQFVPIIVLFLLTGHAADRYDRRIVTWLAQICSAFGAATLAERPLPLPPARTGQGGSRDALRVFPAKRSCRIPSAVTKRLKIPYLAG